MPRAVLTLLLLGPISMLIGGVAHAEMASAVAGGGRHTCAVTTDGAVQCWGDNGSGQLGDGTTMSRSVPVSVLGLGSGGMAVAAGYAHSCAVTTDGAVQCWGNNYSGQLGDGTRTDRATAEPVLGLASGVTAVTAGSAHTCAVTTSGAVQCWGNNYSGQLGDGTRTDRATPAPVLGLASGVTAVAAGAFHTCAVTANGAVQCWGDNGSGQLGDGTRTDRSTPVAIPGLSSGVMAVAAGSDHTCAVTTSGSLQCWGSNSLGQLGDGERTRTDRSTPLPVVGLRSGVTAVAVGGYHTCALITDGTVQCWGRNDSGQLGNGRTTPIIVPNSIPSGPGSLRQELHPIPMPVLGLSSAATALAAGEGHTCAAMTPGGVQCWGDNGSGQLGDGTTMPRSVPVSVPGLSSGVVAVTTGSAHTCAVTTGGALQCWGGNSFGQLGDGTTTVPSPTPVSVVGLSSGVTAVAAGGAHTCAVTTGGAVQCWGNNWSGQLGDGTLISRSTPAPVEGLARGVTAVAAGGSHTCAVTTRGAVQCWGSNGSGQLGDGTTTSRSTPAPVLGLASGVTAVATGRFHTCVVTTDGAVHCWGYNADGQLGDGTTTARATPGPVVGLASGVAAVAAGGSHTCAVTTGGAVQCWGANYSGQLGDGTTTSRSVPVPVLGLISGVTAIDAGGSHTCALITDGTVQCWGGAGQLGDGSSTDRSTPAPVAGLTGGGVAVATGDAHSCLVTADGAPRCWGSNESGQSVFGTWRELTSPSPVGVMGLGTGTRGFFAEGATSPFFATRFALANPGDQPANTWLEFQQPDGTVLPHFLTVPPRTRRTVDVAAVLGTAPAEFATGVTSNEALVVDRTMTWGDVARGPYGGHAERSIAGPAPTWYLAEGSTVGGFNLFYLLQNPNAATVEVRVRYLRPSGAPLEKTYTLAPRSRTNIWVNLETFPGLGQALAATDVSAVIESPIDTPIVAERAMYLDRPGQVFGAGHESAGVTAPATHWILAEGATGPFFDLFVLIANPGDTAATVEATFLLPGGATIVKAYTVSASSRFNIWVDQEGAALADTAVSTTIRSTNDVPIIVERAMWWPGSFSQWYEGHHSPGATTTGTRWALAEGEVGGPRAVDTYILLANTSPTAGRVGVTLLFEDGTSATQIFTVTGHSRFNVDVRAAFPAAADRRFGAVIESLGATPAQIVVERAMYWDAAGQRWAAGTNALATRLP